MRNADGKSDGCSVGNGMFLRANLVQILPKLNNFKSKDLNCAPDLEQR